MQDLYAILNIERNATEADIKAAYRKLARKLHPDVNKAPDAQQQFAELQQAYEVLSDTDKRRRYDRTGRVDANPHADPFAGARQGHHTGGFQGFETDDIGEMFDTFFRGRSTASSSTGRPRARQARPADLDIRAPLTLDLATIASGGKVKARTPAGKTVETTVPKAVNAGATLRIKGHGKAHPPTGATGDLLLEIRIAPHPTFTRGKPNAQDNTSLDLTTRTDVSIATATLGGRAAIDRLGETLTLTIPPATPSGRALRLRGKGLTNAAGKSGDLYAEIRIVPPDPATLTDQQRKLLESLRSEKPTKEPTSKADTKPETEPTTKPDKEHADAEPGS